MESFITSDLVLASTLSALNFQVIDLDRSDESRIGFVFEDTEELQEVVNKFWKEELRLEPLMLFNSMKLLKRRLFSNKLNNAQV